MAKILRQIHRGLALVLALFIIIIGVTGSLLHGIMLLYGDAGPGGNVTSQPDAVRNLREAVLQIHTGFVADLAGAGAA